MMSLCVFRPVLLTLTLLLCSESAAARHEFVEEGECIILPCNDVKDEQRECDGTTWTLKNKQLITNGNISSNVPQTLSNRLRVTQKCGLQIQNVHPQDAGLFYCQQYDQSGRRLSEARVYLSVVSLTKEEHEENTEFRCQVSPALSGVKTEWLFNGRNLNIVQLKTTDLQNGITVPVPKSHRVYKLMDRLTCKVSHRLDKKEFSLRSNEPVKTTTKTTTTTTTTQTKKEETDTRESPKEAPTPASPHTWSTEEQVSTGSELWWRTHEMTLTSTFSDDRKTNRMTPLSDVPESREPSSDHGGELLRWLLFSLMAAAFILCVTVIYIRTWTQGHKAQRDKTSVALVRCVKADETSVTIKEHSAPCSSARVEQQDLALDQQLQ